MDTRTGDIYESKEAATTAGVPDAQGEAPAAAAAPEAALATAQAERSEALMECNCAVLERDAALLRAEQAEAALAQAQAERDEWQSKTTGLEVAVRSLAAALSDARAVADMVRETARDQQ